MPRTEAGISKPSRSWIRRSLVDVALNISQQGLEGEYGRGGRRRGCEGKEAGEGRAGLIARAEGMCELEDKGTNVAVGEAGEEAGDVGALVDALGGLGEGGR